MQNTRPVMQDSTMSSSPFNRSFQERLEMALLDDSIAEKLTREAQVKAGKADKDAYRGISQRDTDLTQRVANVTFQDSNSSEYRTQERINTVLREQLERSKEDLVQQKKYLKDIQEALE